MIRAQFAVTALLLFAACPASQESTAREPERRNDHIDDTMERRGCAEAERLWYTKIVRFSEEGPIHARVKDQFAGWTDQIATCYREKHQYSDALRLYRDFDGRMGEYSSRLEFASKMAELARLVSSGEDVSSDQGSQSRSPSSNASAAPSNECMSAKTYASTHQPSGAADPTLEDTTTWLSQQMTVSAALEISNITKDDVTASSETFSQDVVGVENCTLVVRQIRNGTCTTMRQDLSQIDPASVRVGMYLQDVLRYGKDAAVANKKVDRDAWAVVWDHGGVAAPDRDLAKRMVGAFQHAAKLCGAKVQPF